MLVGEQIVICEAQSVLEPFSWHSEYQMNADFHALHSRHNLIAVASVAGALATATTMKRHGIAGKVILFGTPAEGITRCTRLTLTQADSIDKRVEVERSNSLMLAPTRASTFP